MVVGEVPDGKNFPEKIWDRSFANLEQRQIDFSGKVRNGRVCHQSEEETIG